MSDNGSFECLSTGIKRWIYKEGWKSLRPVQESSIPKVLGNQTDLLILAPTAGGKTEAAFLPLFSLLETTETSGYGVICISPLKALINDQYRRLNIMGETCSVNVTPWHGDIPEGSKRKSWSNPSGILLITPESFESLFVNRLNDLKKKASNLKAIVIDEYHYFLASERGFQLISQLSRLEHLIGKSVPRYGLSATVGDPEKALRKLRPDASVPGDIISSKGKGMPLELTLKTITPDIKNGETFIHLVGNDLFNRLRGSNNLLFANARKNVELLADSLRHRSDAERLPNEFFTHHGSLGKEERHTLERRLKDGLKPTTAIATSTLELGIDLGNVNSVGQITPPSSVNGLRQRLGRSGRRGEPARLRLYVEGKGHLEKASSIDRLELSLLQTVAVLELLFQGWLEPSDNRKQHYSTIVQQILSSIAYTGITSAVVLYETLIKHGPCNMNKQEFIALLRGMGETRLIQQATSGELFIGDVGEKLLNRYDFFATFSTPEEYRLMVDGKPLGTLPSVIPYVFGQLVIFGGRRWIIIDVDENKLIINLKPAGKGAAPKFDGEAAPVHGEIRKKMFHLFQSTNIPAYCDERSIVTLTSAREQFWKEQLEQRAWIVDEKNLYWFIWDGDLVINTLVIILTLNGYEASAYGPVICITTGDNFDSLLAQVIKTLKSEDRESLLKEIQASPLGKFDSYLPKELIHSAFLKEKIDFNAALAYLAGQGYMGSTLSLPRARVHTGKIPVKKGPIE